MLRLGLAVAAAVLVLDQLSKQVMMDTLLDPPRIVRVLPFFDLVPVWNRGVSFGMFGGGTVPAWALALMAVVIAVALLVWLARVARRWPAVAIGLVIGGAIGNVVDRILYGAVFDFLDLHAAGWHWPAFNLADSAITVGVVMLLVESLLPQRPAST